MSKVIKGSASVETPYQFDNVTEERFQKLRRWRKDIADELDQPAFIILHDRTLREIAQKNPHSLDELRQIAGMGDKKIEQFGWDILAELK